MTMEGIKVPTATPRKSRTEYDRDDILIPDIKIEDHQDVVQEVAKEILQENQVLENGNIPDNAGNNVIEDEAGAKIENDSVEKEVKGTKEESEATNDENEASKVENEASKIENEASEIENEASKIENETSKIENEASENEIEDPKDEDEASKTENEASNEENKDSHENEDPEEVIEASKEENEAKVEIVEAQVHEEEPLTISDNLAKTHFPELMQQTEEVYEVTTKEGEVVEKLYAVEPEKAVSNVEALEQIAKEVDNAEDKADIKKLLAWARGKSSKKSKTQTMVIREKKKLDMFKKAVDVDAIPIIIEDSSTYDKNGISRFQVKPTKQATFQVRRKSVIQPVSETVVTRSWLENAIRVFEDEQFVVLINMRFDRDKEGSYEAHIKAEVGENKVEKSYDWVIKEAPKKEDLSEGNEKDTFMIADFGTKLVKFVARKRNVLRVPGQGNFLKFLV